MAYAQASCAMRARIGPPIPCRSYPGLGHCLKPLKLRLSSPHGLDASSSWMPVVGPVPYVHTFHPQRVRLWSTHATRPRNRSYRAHCQLTCGQRGGRARGLSSILSPCPDSPVIVPQAFGKSRLLAPVCHGAVLQMEKDPTSWIPASPCQWRHIGQSHQGSSLDVKGGVEHNKSGAFAFLAYLRTRCTRSLEPVGLPLRLSARSVLVWLLRNTSTESPRLGASPKA